MARRTQSNQIFRLVILWGEVSMVYRKGCSCPLGTGKRRGFFSGTQTQPKAMLTTPFGCKSCLGGDFIPVFWIVLAVDGQRQRIELDVVLESRHPEPECVSNNRCCEQYTTSSSRQVSSGLSYSLGRGLPGIDNRSTAFRFASSPRRSYLAVVTGLA